MSILEIENAIQSLPSSEFSALMEWLEEYRWERWDAQIVDDLKSGRLDRLLAEVEAEIERGNTLPL